MHPRSPSWSGRSRRATASIDRPWRRLSSVMGFPSTREVDKPLTLVGRGPMKRATGLLLLSICSLLTTGSLLYGCGSKDEGAPAGMTGQGDAAAPAAQKFTIVGAGK